MGEYPERSEGGGGRRREQLSHPHCILNSVQPDHAVRFARANRKAMTDAETWIWVRLRRNQLGVSFRRQVVIGPYIVDFACLALKLVVEIDGSQHWDSEYDRRRDTYLLLHGWTVLRIETTDVLRDPESAVGEIVYSVETLTHR